PPSPVRSPPARAPEWYGRRAGPRRSWDPADPPRRTPPGWARSSADARQDVALRALDVLREIDLGPRHPVDPLEADGNARQEVGVDLLVLDAGLAARDPFREEIAQDPRRVARELQEADRLAGELVSRSAAAHDVANPAAADEQHLLLASDLDAAVEEEAVGLRGVDQPLEHRRRAEDVGVHHDDRAGQPPARGREEPLADTGREDDRRHRPSTASRATRKRSKSAVERCPMLATRKMSRWRRPCPSYTTKPRSLRPSCSSR